MIRITTRFSWTISFVKFDIFATYKAKIKILRGVFWEVGCGWIYKIKLLVICGIFWDIG